MLSNLTENYFNMRFEVALEMAGKKCYIVCDTLLHKYIPQSETKKRNIKKEKIINFILDIRKHGESKCLVM